MDKHHVAGKSNHPTVIEINVNHHRAFLSEDQHDWPKETLENPLGCPLRAAAACVRGFIDTVAYLFEHAVHWVADFLETLSDYLTKKLGPDWWIGTPLELFAPRRKDHVNSSP